jgi:signal transduction histidine kinase
MDESWLLNFRIKIFKLLLLISIFFLLMIVARSLFDGGFAIVDMGNAVFFTLLFLCVTLKPKKFRILAWLGLLALFLNTIDGFRPSSNEVIIPSYLLYPLLVLYGALLGDIWITLVAVLGVTGIYGYIWLNHKPLERDDFYSLTNLCLLVFGTGFSALAVWYQHHKLMKMLRGQSHDLRIELDNKLRLNTLIFHDIVNPLTVIEGTSQMMEETNNADPDDIRAISKMSKKMVSIIESARGIESGFNIEFKNIPIDKLFKELQDMFLVRIKAKELKFKLNSPSTLMIYSNLQLMCNSVIGNFLSNAIKFSPRGGTITMTAEKSDDMIRISIVDNGAGFSSNLLNRIKNGSVYFSLKGTEGEPGNAYGISIALLFLNNLNGYLEVKNQENGGACVSALLPSCGTLTTT